MDITVAADGDDDVDYRALLVKYILHVGAAEGFDFAFDVDMAPCSMGKHAYTEGDIEDLVDVFTEARNLWASQSE